MSGEILGTLAYAARPAVLRRSVSIALLVGAVLSAANQGGLLLRGPWTWGLYAKIAFNFLVPFIVSSVSAAANREKKR
ncbi:MAG: hypothetical protein SF051_11560 [Elusimicrobiota bacterium]|nr:hypothetical protein [Elusimicrobiota bacterium]